MYKRRAKTKQYKQHDCNHLTIVPTIRSMDYV